MVSRQLKSDTLNRYEWILRGLNAFAEERDVRYLANLTAEILVEFRATWQEKNLTAVKKLDRLKSFCNFAVEMGWLPSSPAKSL
jgi:site-specific recombinase XerD